MLKKIETSHIVMIVAAIALGYAIYNYSRNKGTVSDGMRNEQQFMDQPSNFMNEVPNQSTPVETGGNPQPSGAIETNSDYACVSGLETNQHGMSMGMNKPTVDPSELLPRDENSEWAQLHRMGSGELQDVNLLKAGHNIGINTVSSSLRNANLQLRSEPANPQMNVGPWNNTTIQPDANRRPLEIGCN